MTATVSATVIYGLDADAYLVARAADRALEGSGVRIMVAKICDDAEVWIMHRNNPPAMAKRFLPGEQLIVERDGTWHIEDAAVTA